MDDKPLWKRQRITILESIIKDNIHEYEVFSLPTNAVRSNERKDISALPFDRQEEVLFNEFIAVCRGTNGPYIQCLSNNNAIIWIWANDKYKKENSNVCLWMERCFEMGTSLFNLQIIISHLRNNFTRGPIVYTFCSVVLHFLRKNVFAQLNEFDQIEGKNLLTLKRYCQELNDRILGPLLHVTKQIEQDEKVGGELINFLFEQKGRTECYHITGLLDDIISMALLRYNQNIFEWISQCTLTSDLAHEFFIWDLRKQNVIPRNEFGRGNELDWSDFDKKFVRIPELLPEDYHPVAKEIYNLGRYLYTMKQQHADIEHMSDQYLLDVDAFKNKSLGEFCSLIVQLYNKCSENILDHLKTRFDIINLAKQFPHFFIGLNSTWIYEFVALESQYSDEDLNQTAKRFPHLLQQAFQSNWIHSSPFHKYFEIQVSSFILDKKSEESNLKPTKGTFPCLELNIIGNNLAMKLAFPARVIEPYRKIFYHLFILNRTKYIVNSKYFMRQLGTSREELTTLFLFLRFLNTYQEYIYGITLNGYAKFTQILDSVRTLDELVEVQQNFVNDLMDQMKLDQDFLQLKEWIVELSNTFCDYANNIIDFQKLDQEASVLVGRIKKFLLEHRRRLGSLKELLFGCYFSAIGEEANKEEHIWQLLRHVDDATAMAAAIN